MRFIDLDIENIGVYRGKHHFDLQPTSAGDDGDKNLVIICGRNGAGKSTLFRCVKLALYGKLAFGDRLAQKQYEETISRYLEDRSRLTGGDLTGSVQVCFEYMRSGALVEMAVRRSWVSTNGTLKESLSVLVDGAEPDILDDEYRDRLTQDLIFDFLPFDLSDACFFDAEQLDSLSSPEAHNVVLGHVLRRFLGLDVVVRLYEDIQRYIDDYVRSQGGSRETTALRESILDTQEHLNRLRSDLTDARTRLREFTEQKRKMESALKRLERKLASQGGTYAEKRLLLQEQLQSLESKRDREQSDLVEMCGELLPFALVCELLCELETSLQREAAQQRDELAAEVLSDKRKSLVRSVGSDDFWKDLPVAPELRQDIVSRLAAELSLLEPRSELEQSHRIHHITDVDRQHILEWIRLALTDTPRKAIYLCDSMAFVSDNITRLHAEIDRAPDDAVLAAIHYELSAKQNELDKIRTSEDELQHLAATVQYQIIETEKDLRAKRDKLIKSQSAEYNLDLANRSKLVLKTYEDALLRTRLQDIETSIARNFSNLCHKTDLIASVQIDLEDYSVSLYTDNGSMVVLSELSAGERQLYVVSLLWALRQASGRDLPLLVDTPVAKLDEAHGWQLIHEFFPKVSRQVVLFAHTKEMDQGLLQEAEPYTARRYLLEYDDQLGESRAVCNPLESTGISAQSLVATAAE